jgi:hypothetical protein
VRLSPVPSSSALTAAEGRRDTTGANRATELAERSVECAFLRASVLWALATNTDLRHAECIKYVRATVAECERILSCAVQDAACEVRAEPTGATGPAIQRSAVRV